MAQSITQGGQQTGGQQSGGQQSGGQTGYGTGQGGGFGGSPQGIELHLRLDDVDELECLMKSLSDTQQQLSQSEGVPTWMKSKYLPRIQALRNAIIQQVNQQFRPGAQHPAAQQITQALETV